MIESFFFLWAGVDETLVTQVPPALRIRNSRNVNNFTASSDDIFSSVHDDVNVPFKEVLEEEDEEDEDNDEEDEMEEAQLAPFKVPFLCDHLISSLSFNCYRFHSMQGWLQKKGEKKWEGFSKRFFVMEPDHIKSVSLSLVIIKVSLLNSILANDIAILRTKEMWKHVDRLISLRTQLPGARSLYLSSHGKNKFSFIFTISPSGDIQSWILCGQTRFFSSIHPSLISCSKSLPTLKRDRPTSVPSKSWDQGYGHAVVHWDKAKGWNTQELGRYRMLISVTFLQRLTFIVLVCRNARKDSQSNEGSLSFSLSIFLYLSLSFSISLYLFLFASVRGLVPMAEFRLQTATKSWISLLSFSLTARPHTNSLLPYET